MRPLRVLLFGMSFGLSLMGCPEPDPEGEDAGSGGRDAGLSDVSSDAGVADASGADLAQADARQPDGATPDSSLPDSSLPDSSAPDSSVGDALLPDSATPDSAVPEDAAASDAAATDSAMPDSAMPDTSLPDVGTDPYIQVFSPNGGERLAAGFEHEITWGTANLADTVFIYYSKDYFTSDVNVIAADQLDDGTHTWTVPDDLSNSVRVKVAATTALDTVFDISDMPFEIVAPEVTVTSPNGGEQLTPDESHAITWTSNAQLGAVRIEYSTDDFVAEAVEIVASTPDDGSYLWPAVPRVSTDNLKIRISAVQRPEVIDVSDDGATILPWFILTSPVGGESWNAGQSRAITWDAAPNASTVSLEYSTDGFERDVNTIAAGVENSGRYTWLVVPDLQSSTVQIRARLDDRTGLESSSTRFTVDRGGWGQIMPRYHSDAWVAMGSRGTIFAAIKASSVASVPGCHLRRYDLMGQPVFDIAVEGDAVKCGVTADGAGAVYLFGEHYGVLDLDPGAGEQLMDAGTSVGVFIVKFNEDGVYQWGRPLTDSAGNFRVSQVASSDAAQVILLGQFSTPTPGTPIDLDPGAGEELRPYADESDVYLVALDAATGDFSWGETWGGSGHENSMGLAVDVAGKFYASGSFLSDPLDFDPGAGQDLHATGAMSEGFIARYSAAGVYEGVRTWGGDGTALPRALATDSNGNLFAVGDFGGTAVSAIDFQTTGAEPWLLEVDGRLLTFVAKYDRNFNFVWAHSMGGHATNGTFHALVRPAGDIMLFGMYQQHTGVIDLDPGEALLTPPEGAPANGGFLASLDADGVLDRVQVLEMVFVSSLATSGQNTVAIAGQIIQDDELAPVLPPCSALSCPAPSSAGAIAYFDADLCW